MFILVAAALLQLIPTAAEDPYRAPQLATSPSLVALAFGSGTTIYVATSADQGTTFSAPVRVAESGVLPLGRHRGPRIVFSKGAMVVTAVAGSKEQSGPHAHGLPLDGDLFAWRSVDGGKSWSKGVRINDVPSAAREGLHALASDGRGNLAAVWLDLRKEGTQLYGAFSRDSGKTWSANQLLYKSPDNTICQCCHPSAAYSEDGTLAVMWRNDVGGSRDQYLMQSRAGKLTEPVKLGDGTWKINACPMDGGGLARDGSRIVTAWRREGDIFMAEPGKPEIKLGEGKDVAIAASQPHVFVVWITKGELQLWRDGKTETLADIASMPNISALVGGGAVVAWEQDRGISVRRLP